MAGRDPKIGGRKARAGRQALRFEALNPVEGTPTPPDYFGEHEIFAWVQACRSLIPARHVSHADLLALEAMAVNFGRWRRAEAKCRRYNHSGTYATTPNGFRQLSADRIEANQAQAQFFKIGLKFGLTPVERIKTTENPQGDLFAGLSLPKEPAETEDDKSEDGRAFGTVFKPRLVQRVG